MTSKRLESMLPINEVCTITICGGFATKAKIETMSSTALLEQMLAARWEPLNPALTQMLR